MEGTMKAAVMHGPNDIRVEDIARPKCEPGGIIIEVKAVGLCGSDIRNLTSDSRGPDGYPHVYGHEVVGVVCEAGPEQTKYKVGDRLATIDAAPCLTCETCRSGHSENCEHFGDIDYFNRQGGFAQYYPIPALQVQRGNIFSVPEGVEWTHASLGEPLGSVYACQDNIDVRMGDRVVILGAGPIGCFHVRIAKMRGASQVIVSEYSEKRLEMIKQFEPDAVINGGKEDAVKRVWELTGGKGATKVISANPTVAGQLQAIKMAAPGGIIVFFGGVPKGQMTEIDSNYIHYHNLWIYGHSGANSIQGQRAFELAMSGAFDPDKFITHVLPLSEINHGIELMKSGEAIKVVLIP